MKELIVEIADTPASQEQGLMFRQSLSEDAGMLFKFDKPRKLGFWGVNTFLPLDICFANKENEIVNFAHIKPLSEKVVTSDDDCIIAIEANMDFFAKNNINIGDSIRLDKDSSGNDIVIFG